jgi:hypothetical protein
MKIGKYIPSIILMALLGVSLFLNSKLNKKMERMQLRIQLSSIIEKNRFENIELELKNSVIGSEEIQLYSAKGDTLCLNPTLFCDKKTQLFFRYDGAVCESCIKALVKSVREVLGQEEILEDIIILGPFDDINTVRVNNNYWGSKNCYGVVSDSSPLRIEKPYFFVMDKECRIIHTFIPDPNNPKETKIYLKAYSELIKGD